MTITDVDGLLPEPQDLLAGTDWASLEHACGTAAETPALLAGLLADDVDTQARALRHLKDPVHHQNTIYSATVHAAAYVAKILRAPRTSNLVTDRDSRVLPLRPALLDWVKSVTIEVDSEAETHMARVGLCLDEHPESVQIRPLRPGLFQAVSAFSTLRTLLFRKQPLLRLFRSWAPRSPLGSGPFSRRWSVMCWPPATTARIASSPAVASSPGDRRRVRGLTSETRTCGRVAAAANHLFGLEKKVSICPRPM